MTITTTQHTTQTATATTVHHDGVVMLGSMVTVERTDRDVVYRVTGSVDMSNAGVLADVLAGDLPDGRNILLELSGVDFFGTAALTVVAALDSRCTEAGTDLTLVVGDAVVRVMEAARWQPAARVVRPIA